MKKVLILFKGTNVLKLQEILEDVYTRLGLLKIYQLNLVLGN
jgi:hypothetical protein